MKMTYQRVVWHFLTFFFILVENLKIGKILPRSSNLELIEPCLIHNKFKKKIKNKRKGKHSDTLLAQGHIQGVKVDLGFPDL